MSARYDLDGKVVLVTGAARGIGAATARRLAARGARVSLVGLEPDGLRALADELGDARAVWFEADVTSYTDVERAARGTVERFGGIDVTVANAGVAPNAPLGHIEPALFDRTMAVNVGGVYHAVRATYPHVTARGGYFLAIASLAAALHPPLLGAYAASKAAVEALGNTLRQEVAHTGARVGVAYLAFVDTDMLRRGFGGASAGGLERRLGPMLARRATVEEAGAALVDGIERRARQIGLPGWALTAARLRGVLQPLGEAIVVRRGAGDLVERAARAPQRLTTVQPDGTGGDPAARRSQATGD